MSLSNPRHSLHVFVGAAFNSPPRPSVTISAESVIRVETPSVGFARFV
jgi:hypothetical protein